MRVLLIEDEPGISRFIKKGLEEENYTVDIADNGEDGLHMGVTENYDIIVLDVMLPKIDGFEVCAGVRRAGISTPILMLTAKVAVSDKVRGLDSGADDYLTKPFSFDEFLARIRSLMRRGVAPSPKLSVCELSINLQSHRAYIGGQELVLRPKEYAMLEYLLRNSGRIVTRTQITENVWGYDFDSNTNIVDVHIKSLRKKIAELTDKCYIQTKRGMGYMLDKQT